MDAQGQRSPNTGRTAGFRGAGRWTCAALAVALGLSLAGRARACSVTAGNDAEATIAGYSANPYTYNPTFSQTGSNSYLFFVMASQANPANFGTVSVSYNGSPMTELGTATETASNSCYYEVYYLANPAKSGQVLSVNLGSSYADSYGWCFTTFSYGNCTLGNSKFVSNAFDLSSGGTATPNLSFTLASSSATVIEGLAWASAWGSTPSSYSVSPGSVFYISSNLGNSEAIGLDFGSASGFATAAFSATETLVTSGQTGGAVYGIELDPACGSGGSTPTYTLTPSATPRFTPTNTAPTTPMPSPTITQTPTQSLVSPTNSPTWTASPTPTPQASATPSPAVSPSDTPYVSPCGAPNVPLYGGTNYYQTSWAPGFWTPTASVNLTYFGTGPTAGGTGSNAASAGSVLFVFFIDQTVTATCAQPYYDGVPMGYLAGPVIEPNNNSGDPDYSWWVYYIQDPQQNQPLYIAYDPSAPNNGSLYAFTVDVGNTTSNGGPIGTYSLGTSPFMGSVSSNVGNVSQSLSVKPRAANSMFLYFLPMLGSGWGYTQNNITNANCDVTFNPVSSYGGPYGGWSGCPSCYDPLFTDPITGTYGAGNLDFPVGGYVDCNSSPFTYTGGFNSGGNYQDYGLLWYIEVLANGVNNSATSSYGSCGAGATPSPTPTPTATPENTPVIVYQGLPADMRPYGLEYVPFPTVTAGSDQFYPLYTTFSSESPDCSAPPCSSGSYPNVVNSYGAPVNTARWHIVLTGLSGQIKVETRIGIDGVACTSGVYDSAFYATATALTLPQYPQDDSDTYFWVGTTQTGSSAVGTVASGGVPYTERFDAVGDPRFVPYADELDFSGNPAADGLGGGYNWFWRNFAGSSYAYGDAAQDPFYAPYMATAHQHDGYYASGQSSQPSPDYDVPKLYALVRDGILSANGVYLTLAGYSSAVAALGGEIGGDHNSGFQNGVPCFGGPWGSDTTPYYVDEIVGQQDPGYDSNVTAIQAAGACLVVTGTSSTNIGWASLPFLGELWPDGLYQSQWQGNWTSGGSATWGNLANPDGSAGGSAFRVPLQNSSLPLGTTATSLTGTFFRPTLHQAGYVASASLFDGDNANSGYFAHVTATSYAAALLNDAAEAGGDYNVPVPSSFYDIAEPWGEDAGSLEPPEWTDPTYSQQRTHLDVYAAATYTAGGASSPADWGYYSAPSSEPNNTSYKGAAAIRAVDENLTLTTATGDAAGGWFVVDGFSPEAVVGGDFMSQFALMQSLRTVADAGVPTATACSVCGTFSNPNNTYSGTYAASGKSYRIPPIPLVTVLSPTASTNLKGATSVPISWDLRYARWDGQQYDENYPCVDAAVGPCTSGDVIPDPTKEWEDPQAVAFNVIYNSPSGLNPTTWYSAATGAPVAAGWGNAYTLGGAGNYLSDAADAILPGSAYQTSPYQYTYTWKNVPAGSYLVRVECFRLPSEASAAPFPHYGYDQVSVDTQP